MAIEREHALWIRPEGPAPRLSDGSAAEQGLDTIALHVMGWIEIERNGTRTLVRLDPYAVRKDVLDQLEGVVAHRYRGRSIEVVILNGGLTGVPVTFFDTAEAIRHIHRSVAGQRGGVDDEPPIDSLAAGMRQDDLAVTPLRVEGTQAAPSGGRFGGGRQTAEGHGSIRQGCARPIHEIEASLLDESQVIALLDGAIWIDEREQLTEDLAHALGMSESGLTPNIGHGGHMTPYALFSLGWIGIERDRARAPLLAEVGDDIQDGDPGADKDETPIGRLQAELPRRVVLDPATVESGALTLLATLCGDWAEAPGTLELIYFDGLDWTRVSGSAEEVLWQVDRLIRVHRRHDADAPAAPMADALGLSPDRDFEGHFRLWLERGGPDQSESDFVEALEAADLVDETVTVDRGPGDGELRLTLDRPDATEAGMAAEVDGLVGKLLLTPPDRIAETLAPDDLQEVLRTGAPSVREFRGSVRAGGRVRVLDGSRMTFPVRGGSGEAGIQMVMLSRIDRLDNPPVLG